MKILIIGANGQLGWELCRRGRQRGFDITGVDLPAIDITEYVSVENTITRLDVSLVVNAAAYTAVDQAESEPELAFAVNRDGPANIAACCSEVDVPLVHISTDYVFGGDKKSSYLVTDPVSPTSVYGKSKAAGEEAVRRALEKHIIIRTAWLYGIHGNNFVKTMLRLGKEKETLRVVADQHGSPTYVGDLAEAILTVDGCIRKGQKSDWGTYHFCNSGETTWHGFAESIFRFAGDRCALKVKQVEPIATAEYPTPAKRPVNSVLDCSLITKNFGIVPPSWEESLENVVRTLAK